MLSAFAARRVQVVADATQNSTEEVTSTQDPSLDPTLSTLPAKRKQNSNGKSPPPSRKRKKSTKLQDQAVEMDLEENTMSLSSSFVDTRAYSPSVLVHSSPYNLEPERRV